MKNPEVEVRVDWSAQEHSLIAFFEANNCAARKVRSSSQTKRMSLTCLSP